MKHEMKVVIVGEIQCSGYPWQEDTDSGAPKLLACYPAVTTPPGVRKHQLSLNTKLRLPCLISLPTSLHYNLT